MRHIRSVLVVALVVALPASTSAQTALASTPGAHPQLAQLLPDSLERARKFTLWLYTNQTDSLFAYSDSASRHQLGTPKALEETVAALAVQAGSEEQLLGERWVTRLGKRQYWRTARFSGVAEPFLVRLVIVAPGTFAGMGMGLASQAPPIDP